MPKEKHILTESEKGILNELSNTFANIDDDNRIMIKKQKNGFYFFISKIENLSKVVLSSLQNDFESGEDGLSEETKKAILRYFAMNYMQRLAEDEASDGRCGYLNRLNKMSSDEIAEEISLHAKKLRELDFIRNLFEKKDLFDVTAEFIEGIYPDGLQNNCDIQKKQDIESKQLPPEMYEAETDIDLSSNSGMREFKQRLNANLNLIVNTRLPYENNFPLLTQLKREQLDQISSINHFFPKSDPQTLAFDIKDELIRFTAVNQIISFAEKELQIGKTDFITRLSAMSRPELNRVILFAEKNLRDSVLTDKFFTEGTPDELLAKVSEISSFNKNKEIGAEQNKKLEIRAALNPASCIKEELGSKLKLIEQKLNPVSRASTMMESLTKSLCSEIGELRENMSSVVNKDGTISDFGLKKFCNIVAIYQVLSEQKNNPGERITTKGINANYKKVKLLANALLNSDMIKNDFKSDTPASNALNFLNSADTIELFAKKLNALPYAKNILSGNETPQTQSSISEIEAAVYKDSLARMRYDEGQYLKNNEMQDGYYNAGTVSYANTKKDMQSTGESLSKWLHSPVFSLVNNRKNPARSGLTKLFNGLNDVSKLLKEYGLSISDFSNNADRASAFKNDAEKIQAISKKLENIIETCQDLMLFDLSDSPDFQKMYSEIVNASGKIDSITDGNLFVPESGGDSEEDTLNENGKTVRFIKAETNPDLSYLKEDYTKSLEEDSIRIEWDKSNEPPFSHDPCPADIIQGYVGDCYFVSSLAAVAAKNPQAIRDMMSFNPVDNTVTVRLYNMNDEPVYITMENSIPRVKGKAKGLDCNYTYNALSSGARWVTLMEKAFIQSDLVKSTGAGVNIGKERNIDNGGVNAYVMKCLFGPALEGHNAQSTLDNYDFCIPKADRKIFPKEYLPDDLELYAELKKLYDKGIPLTCATPKGKVKEENILGLNAKHAYGIVGFAEEDGFKYVYVKNPHGTGIRSYENGKPVEIQSTTGEGGVSKLELNDFLSSFLDITALEFSRSPIDRHNDYIIEQEKLLYLETIKEMDFMMTGCNENSAEFLKLKETSSGVLSAFENPEMTPNKLSAALREYFYASEKYINLRDTNPKAPEEEGATGPATAYYAANVISKLAEKFFENEFNGLDKAQPVSVDDLKNEALSVNENDSPAKQGSVNTILKEKNIKFEKELLQRSTSKSLIVNSMNAAKTNIDLARQSGIKDQMLFALSVYAYYENLNNKMDNLTQKQIDIELEPGYVKEGVESLKNNLSKVAAAKPEKFSQLFKLPKADDAVRGIKEIIAETTPKKILEHQQKQTAKANKKKSQAGI